MSTQTEVERRSRLPFDLLRHLDRAWYTDVLLYSIETHLKVEIVVVVSDNLWKFDTIPDMSGVRRDLRKGRNGLGKCNNFKILCYILR